MWETLETRVPGEGSGFVGAGWRPSAAPVLPHASRATTTRRRSARFLKWPGTVERLAHPGPFLPNPILRYLPPWMAFPSPQGGPRGPRSVTRKDTPPFSSPHPRLSAIPQRPVSEHNGPEGMNDVEPARRRLELVLAACVYTSAGLYATRPMVHAGIDHVVSSFSTEDILLCTWILSWDVHALLTHPFALFQGNILYPASNTLALSEHLLGDLPTFAPVWLLTGNPVLALNVTIVVSFLLCGVGMHLLIRRWTGSQAAAYVAGLAYVFAPWRQLTFHWPHLLETQYFPLLLWAIDRVVAEGSMAAVCLAVVFIALQLLCSYYLAYMAGVLLACYLIVQGALGMLRRHWRALGISVGVPFVILGVVSIPYVTGGSRVAWDIPPPRADGGARRAGLPGERHIGYGGGGCGVACGAGSCAPRRKRSTSRLPVPQPHPGAHPDGGCRPRNLSWSCGTLPRLARALCVAGGTGSRLLVDSRAESLWHLGERLCECAGRPGCRKHVPGAQGEVPARRGGSAVHGCRGRRGGDHQCVTRPAGRGHARRDRSDRTPRVSLVGGLWSGAPSAGTSRPQCKARDGNQGRRRRGDGDVFQHLPLATVAEWLQRVRARVLRCADDGGHASTRPGSHADARRLHGFAVDPRAPAQPVGESSMVEGARCVPSRDIPSRRW